MAIIDNIYTYLKNSVLNGVGVERDFLKLIKDKDVEQIQSSMQNFDEKIQAAIKEYNPDTHEVMSRVDKPRKGGREPYKVQKLPRGWQAYINEVALFFLLAKPIKWKNNISTPDTDKAFNEFQKFLKETRFDTTMRQAKRKAGAETMSAKLYHIYRDANDEPRVKVIVLSLSNGYTLRPLFDQYQNLVAFGYGYYLKEGDKSVEHFDIQTPQFIYRCKRARIGWEVVPVANPTGKINVILYQQEKEWERGQHRINRDEFIDSKSADINEYFADPMAAATADVINNLTDPEQIGKLIKLTSKDSEFRYIEPPTASDMKEGEKKVLRESILQDTLTPDFSFENMSGMGSLSGEAIRRAMILGYIKRDNSKEIYDIAVDREKNLILSIMANVTHIEMKDALEKLDIEHEFAEPFDEDFNTKLEKLSTAVSNGVMSIETAVTMLGAVRDVNAEVEKIIAEKAKMNIKEPVEE